MHNGNDSSLTVLEYLGGIHIARLMVSVVARNDLSRPCSFEHHGIMSNDWDRTSMVPGHVGRNVLPCTVSASVNLIMHVYKQWKLIKVEAIL